MTSPEVDPTGAAAAPRTRAGMSHRQWIALAVLVPIVLVGAFVAGRALMPEEARPGIQLGNAEDASEFDWDYVIPAGTAARIQAGEEVEIVPADLTVRVGDVIRIVNDDTSDHIVGVFFVGAGETLTQRFKTEGVLQGECSVHSSGSFTLRVEP
jgi:plastocyanin